MNREEPEVEVLVEKGVHIELLHTRLGRTLHTGIEIHGLGGWDHGGFRNVYGVQNGQVK